MSERPSGVHATLEMIRRLKATITDCISREENVESNYRLKTARAKREHEEASSIIDTNLQNILAEEQSSLHNKGQAAEAVRQKRSARIRSAHTNALAQVSDTLEGEKSRRISQVQSKTLEAKRQKETKLAEAKKTQIETDNLLHASSEEEKRLRHRARSAFRGFQILSKRLGKPLSVNAKTSEDAVPEIPELCKEIEQTLGNTQKRLNSFKSLIIPKTLSFFPPQWVTPLAVIGIGILGYSSDWLTNTWTITYAIAAVLIIFLLLIQRISSSQAKSAVGEISNLLTQTYEKLIECRNGQDEWAKENREAIEENLNEYINKLNEDLGSAIGRAEKTGQSGPDKIEEQRHRLLEQNEAKYSKIVDSIRIQNENRIKTAHKQGSSEKDKLDTERANQIATAEAEHKESWQNLESVWKSEIETVVSWITDDAMAASTLFPEWDREWLEAWKPPQNFPHSVTFGSLEADPSSLADGLPEDPRLSLPNEGSLVTPLSLRFPDPGSLLFETETSGSPEIIDSINNIILRLLSVAPAGKLSFSILDPVGLGQNFAGITHLADYEDSIINNRIWTQREQIEARITELNEHMEKVIQMYLRNEYETITEYNKKAGNIAEKYHFLVIADFPTNFSEAATRGLMSIAASGARCGIYTLVHWDKRQPLPEAFEAEDLRQSSICIHQKKNEPLQFLDGLKNGTLMRLDLPPPDKIAIDFVQRIGTESSDSNRIEVPFSHIIPGENEYWKGDTTDKLSVPIGRTGATKLQHLSIGSGTRQHALLAGKTGSGKSTLFHVMITNLALHCSPDQVEFYLVDFKKGVEFKCYGSKKLPHAKVVAIESDREFGLSVLQRLDAELKRRGELFRDLGVQDIAGFKRADGGVMPRTLLMIDEFQEFFVEDDKIAQQASVLLDRIVRQGRAFGIHALLGSQTLGGAYSLARATLGQMVIRIALMCNEADAYLIMDEGNPAPRLLTRPGEGIYNDSAGAIEGNSPFQTVWLPEEERDSHLDHINKLNHSAGRDPGSPIVFEGNSPADVTENLPLAKLLKKNKPPSPISPKIWLGAPNAIKGPTEAVFHRQSGNHLLIVGQRDDAVLAMLSIGIVTLAAQYPKDNISFFLIDSNPPGSPERNFLELTAKSLSHRIDTNFENDAGELINLVAEEMKKREDSTAKTDPPIFIMINGVQRFKKLRYDDDLAYSFDASSSESNPALQLNDIITDGPPLGIHLIIAIDSYNNIGRTLSRKGLSEFEMRILFQMSANDSAALVDSTKASNVGMHRALFYSEHEGYLETFRPYSQPNDTWITEHL